MADLVLAGGTVYPDPASAPLPDAAVLIQDGRIAAVGPGGQMEFPAGTTVVDCAGSFITAGFWNSHVHFFERKWAKAETIPAPELERQLQEMLTRYGFTSVFDLSSALDNTQRIRARIESGEVAGPRIRSTGQGLLPVNPGLPPEAAMRIMGVMTIPLPEVGDAAQAAAAARRVLELGADGVKLFASAPSKATIPEEAMRAAVEEARGAGKPTFVHPNSAADIAAAVRAGVEVIGHTTPASGPWSPELIGEMRQRNVALTPTLTLWQYYLRHDRFSAQEQTVRTAVGQLRDWIAAGGEVLFGTDLGAVDPDPTPEYLLMAQAGMSFREILASLTTVPAARFGDGARLGRIAPGFDADLVALAGDPEHDVRALAAARLVIRAGRVIHSAGHQPYCAADH